MRSFGPNDTVVAHVIVMNNFPSSQYTLFGLDKMVETWIPVEDPWLTVGTESALVAPGTWEMRMTTTAAALRSPLCAYRMRVTPASVTNSVEYHD